MALLQPGGSKQLKITPVKDMNFDVHMAAYGDERRKPKTMCLLGIIKYWDELKHMRRTVFCRRWNPTMKRFEVVDDPDFEYVD